MPTDTTLETPGLDKFALSGVLCLRSNFLGLEGVGVFWGGGHFMLCGRQWIGGEELWLPSGTGLQLFLLCCSATCLPIASSLRAQCLLLLEQARLLTSILSC